MDNKKITLIISNLSDGGAQGVCITIANYFANSGVDVDLVVLSLDNAVWEAKLDKKVNLINLNTINVRKSFFKMKNYFFKKKPTDVLVFNYELSILLVWIRFVFRLRFRLLSRSINTLSEIAKTGDSFWYRFIVSPLIRFFYKKVDMVICQSVNMAKDLIDNYNFNEKKIVVINNPINPQVENYIVLENQQAYDQKPMLLFIGRLEQQKGIHYLLEAFSKINRKEVILKIIGKGSLESELKKLTVELNITDRVFFEGYQKDIIPYIVNAKATVLTSLYEGFPNVLVESIALGTPIVAFDCPSGPSEIILDSVNGYLVNYLDINDLIVKLNTVISQKFNKGIVKETALRFKSDVILLQYKKVLFG